LNLLLGILRQKARAGEGLSRTIGWILVADYGGFPLAGWA